MFLNSFQRIQVSSFQCDTCEFTKYTRISFPISQNKNSIHLIHRSIWEPLTVPSIYGARWFLTLIDDYTLVT